MVILFFLEKANKQESNLTLRNTVARISSPQSSNNNMNEKWSSKTNASSGKTIYNCFNQNINVCTIVNLNQTIIARQYK